MGKGGTRKGWPRSWKQAAVTGGTLTLKGRSVEVNYVVLPLRVEGEGPGELEERVEDALVAETLKMPPS